MPGFVLAQFTKSIPATAYRALHAVITCGCQRDKSVFPKRLNLMIKTFKLTNETLWER